MIFSLSAVVVTTSNTAFGAHWFSSTRDNTAVAAATRERRGRVLASLARTTTRQIANSCQRFRHAPLAGSKHDERVICMSLLMFWGNSPRALFVEKTIVFEDFIH
jgi:hypothetical protein